jgi:hypothetical protein
LIDDSSLDPAPADYCREIEAYLCQKNDGHLIRVVGPSFEMVSRWAADGVPIKVAFRGIDRYFERYYKKGPRRRPVRVDFCEADVLDVFDEWRRATGLIGGSAAGGDPGTERTPRSLPAHLERVVLRLTNALASGVLGEHGRDLDDLTTRVSRELDGARAAAGGVRGEARRALLARLAALDAELLTLARSTLDPQGRALIERDANEELAAFRDRMPREAYERALAAIVDRLARERLTLPTITF